MFRNFVLVAAPLALVAAPAAAQTVTGTIDMTGTVAAKCFVVPTNGSTFTDSVDFTALDQANGTLRTGLATDFGTRNYTVKCNGTNPKLAITANVLATATPVSAGYDNSIDFSATVSVDATGANATTATPAAFTDSSTTVGGTTATAVGSSLANAANNIHISTTGYATNTATDLLAVGTYTGSVVVTISPT